MCELEHVVFRGTTGVLSCSIDRISRTNTASTRNPSRLDRVQNLGARYSGYFEYSGNSDICIPGSAPLILPALAVVMRALLFVLKV